jgi:hypothetical protein
MTNITNIVPKPTPLKGNGNGSKGVTGHRGQYKGVKYQTGTGCKEHRDCFTCPFSDCVRND